MTASNRPLYGQPLDPAEIDILIRLACGHEYSDIALDTISAHGTVGGAVSRIYRKLGAHNGPHAVGLGIGTGQIPADAAIQTLASDDEQPPEQTEEPT